MELGWEKIKVPLGWVVAAMMGLYGVYSYAEKSYVHVGDFKAYSLQQEVRALTRQRTQLETDILRLTVKRNLYPNQFDAVDKTILQRQEQLLDETKAELVHIERRQREGKE